MRKYNKNTQVNPDKYINIGAESGFTKLEYLRKKKVKINVIFQSLTYKMSYGFMFTRGEPDFIFTPSSDKSFTHFLRIISND